ncbi:MAG TPA: hypothetical protein VJS90_08025 [Pseudomonas sp.]|uniref:hypothetical protein n=1 Tax=Pseudomonas sp. TaxID=306 RepID=UPI002B4A5F87|nr:hypothetical protein [Pseudomonas sp.]HKS12975.1 hypothetical protein [Pseudomonas sp.]
MANNQDKGASQGGNTNMDSDKAGMGQKGGQGSREDMSNQQKGGQQSGHKPEDKMNKDWDRSRDTGSQGGQAGEKLTDKQKPSDTGRMGGQQGQSDMQQQDKNR